MRFAIGHFIVISTIAFIPASVVQISLKKVRKKVLTAFGVPA